MAQARQSAALRELEEAREERAAVALDASVPVGEPSVLSGRAEPLCPFTSFACWNIRCNLLLRNAVSLVMQ